METSSFLNSHPSPLLVHSTRSHPGSQTERHHFIYKYKRKYEYCTSTVYHIVELRVQLLGSKIYSNIYFVRNKANNKYLGGVRSYRSETFDTVSDVFDIADDR